MRVCRAESIGAAVCSLALLLACTAPADRESTTGNSNAGPTAQQTTGAEPCESASTQLEQNTCWADAAVRAEERVTAFHAAAADSLRAAGHDSAIDSLDETQRAWERYRDAHCAAARAPYEGGSMAPMIEAGCRFRLAEDRARELESIYINRN